MSDELTYEVLKGAIDGTATAFRCVTEYQPAGGPGDKIFPPTYAKAEYATEKRLINGELINCILLDSVQSQANRMEMALLDFWRAKAIKLPVIEIDFSKSGILNEIGQNWRITTLEAPHRIADALFRDSVLEDGTVFRSSHYAEKWGNAKPHNATSLLELCPTALLFGMWGSPRGPGLGGKFARLIVSEIVGFRAYAGVKTSSRIDPAQITLQAGTLYEDVDGSWTLDKSRTGKLVGKKGKPSEAGHGNITPTIERDAGVTIEKAVQTTVLSLPALRRLRFPLDGQEEASFNSVARIYLASLGILGASWAREQGCDLRSRCVLVPTQTFEWEIVDQPDSPWRKFVINTEQARSLYNRAYKHVEDLGFKLMNQLTLLPTDHLAELIKNSQKFNTAEEDVAED
ncbi:MAG: type I-U CRISPR-associated RAMP protein Csb1/Cas7u [Desulfomonilaceae bacterium]